MLTHDMPETYEEAVEYIMNIPLFVKEHDIDNTRRLLDCLGHPEERYRTVHVAGTNGKGSTCAFLESVFRSSGLKTGLFTSPHLVRLNERMRVQGAEIPDDAFLETFIRVRKASDRLLEAGGKRLTFFVFLYAMALCWFESCKIDIFVCETGMGGRLDATNAPEGVSAAVITSISMDHTKYLGDTIEKIAFEKAGIIRAGAPVIYCADDPASGGVIAARACEIGAEQIPLRRESYTVERKEDGTLLTVLRPPGGDKLEFSIPFRAEYQAQNACLAALCALRLGVDREAVASGIASASWSGRMQEIRKDVYLDGAHNPDGIRKISDEIRRISQKRSVWLAVAIVADKDHEMMSRELCRGIEYAGVIVTSVGGHRQLDADILARELMRAGQRNVEVVPEPDAAYRKALKMKGGGVLFCVGSLYFIGEIIRLERSGLGEANHAEL